MSDLSLQRAVCADCEIELVTQEQLDRWPHLWRYPLGTLKQGLCAECRVRPRARLRLVTTPPVPRRRLSDLIEDVEWMAETGETIFGAAMRLHRAPQVLERTLHRAGRGDLVSRLKRFERLGEQATS